jgi:hypothetical protein
MDGYESPAGAHESFAYKAHAEKDCIFTGIISDYHVHNFLRKSGLQVRFIGTVVMLTLQFLTLEEEEIGRTICVLVGRCFIIH